MSLDRHAVTARVDFSLSQPRRLVRKAESTFQKAAFWKKSSKIATFLLPQMTLMEAQNRCNILGRLQQRFWNCPYAWNEGGIREIRRNLRRITVRCCSIVIGNVLKDSAEPPHLCRSTGNSSVGLCSRTPRENAYRHTNEQQRSLFVVPTSNSVNIGVVSGKDFADIPLMWILPDRNMTE